MENNGFFPILMRKFPISKIKKKKYIIYWCFHFQKFERSYLHVLIYHKYCSSLAQKAYLHILVFVKINHLFWWKIPNFSPNAISQNTQKNQCIEWYLNGQSTFLPANLWHCEYNCLLQSNIPLIFSGTESIFQLGHHQLIEVLGTLSHQTSDHFAEICVENGLIFKSLERNLVYN